MIAEGLLDLREQWQLPLSQYFVPAVERKKTASIFSSTKLAKKTPSTITLKIKKRKATPYPRASECYELDDDEEESPQCNESLTSFLAIDGKKIKVEDETEAINAPEAAEVRVSAKSVNPSASATKKHKSASSKNQS